MRQNQKSSSFLFSLGVSSCETALHGCLAFLQVWQARHWILIILHCLYEDLEEWRDWKDRGSVFLWSKVQIFLQPWKTDNASLQRKEKAGLMLVIWLGFLNLRFLFPMIQPTEFAGNTWLSLCHCVDTEVQITGAKIQIHWQLLLLWVISSPLSLTRDLCLLSASMKL